MHLTDCLPNQLVLHSVAFYQVLLGIKPMTLPLLTPCHAYSTSEDIVKEQSYNSILFALAFNIVFDIISNAMT